MMAGLSKKHDKIYNGFSLHLTVNIPNQLIFLLLKVYRTELALLFLRKNNSALFEETLKTMAAFPVILCLISVFPYPHITS